ncbi:hypothetical protein V493_06777 [Pseudogymnoascus sp. VKM F-4281 (FW-2241)]|nr:hypothetical protein V493_06777 [Pseudogymnoascus sp. VKM F-4281 (FW-2241)]
MSSQNQGRQSPPSERQSDSQKASSSSGKSYNGKPPGTAQTSEDQLKDLKSNPRGVMEEHLEEKFKKDFPQNKD